MTSTLPHTHLLDQRWQTSPQFLENGLRRTDLRTRDLPDFCEPDISIEDFDNCLLRTRHSRWYYPGRTTGEGAAVVMEIDPGLKQETPPLPQTLPGSDHSEPGSGTPQRMGVAQGPDRGEMDISTLPSPEGDDALTLLPEVQATGRPVGSRRPFQRRRRSRACDACRARKTKCDTPDHGPCSACVSASLVCKFSGGEDRRRAGPARRLRALESTVQELERKLADAERRLHEAGISIESDHGSMTAKAPHSPMTSTATDLSVTSASSRLSGSSSTHDNAVTRRLSQATSYGELAEYGRVHKKLERKEERYQEDGTSWDHHIFGPSSCPSFLHSYKDYLSRLGYRPPQESNAQESVGEPPLPLSGPDKYLPLDLRALLPPVGMATQLFEVFRKTVQNYTPIFYWPSLEKKIERAWGMPIWDGDGEAVRSVFCVIIMLLAVASQFIEPGELDEPEGGDWADLQARNGWMFFELGRKYSDLNNPNYSIDDAIYLLLMALYLDKAFLPSPCWMITGAMVRVCQDIGIYRRTPLGLYDEVEIESRTRLFWSAYIQDRKISMKLGRPVIFYDQHIDVGLPGLPGVAGKRQEENSRADQDDSDKPPGVTSMEERQSDYEDDQTRCSLQTFKATIFIAKTSESLLSIKLRQNGGDEDIKHLQTVDEMLKKAWEIFPSELTDLSRSDVMDLPAVRPLFHLQHSRIILYRYFTDFTSSPIIHEFRTFCLAQSIQVAKITSHILSRVSQNPEFDRIFGLRTDELVHIHTFRAATVLLLGHYCRDRSLLSVSAEEVDLCARALRSVARSHYLGKKLLKLFEDFAKMFGYQIGLAGESTNPISGGESENSQEQHITPTPANPWTASAQHNQPVALAHPGQFGGYSEFHQPQSHTTTLRWLPSVSAAPPQHQAVPPEMVHPGHPPNTHAGIMFVDPAMPGGGVPTAAAQGAGAEDQVLPQIDWDAYQQMMQFDPSFELYMNGPNDRHCRNDDLDRSRF